MKNNLQSLIYKNVRKMAQHEIPELESKIKSAEFELNRWKEELEQSRAIVDEACMAYGFKLEITPDAKYGNGYRLLGVDTGKDDSNV